MDVKKLISAFSNKMLRKLLRYNRDVGTKKFYRRTMERNNEKRILYYQFIINRSRKFIKQEKNSLWISLHSQSSALLQMPKVRTRQ